MHNLQQWINFFLVLFSHLGTSKIDSTLNSSVVRKLIQSTRVYTNTPKTTPIAHLGPFRQAGDSTFASFWHPTWPFLQRKLASRRTPCSEIQRVSLLEFGVVCIYCSLKMHLKGETNTTKPMKCICLQFGLKIKGRFIYLSWTTQTEDISSRISWQFMLPVTLCNIFMQDEILVALMNTYFSWGQMKLCRWGLERFLFVCLFVFWGFFFGGGCTCICKVLSSEYR